jgi:hypothetical protein
LTHNGTLALHAATRLALELPAGGGGNGRSSGPAHPASVAEAFWRLAYGEEGAPVAALSGPGQEGAVDFLVDLVRQVERRLLDGSAESPAVLARRVVDQTVPTDALERETLCSQLGIPTVELAPERLSFLAWDLCVSLTENLRPIVAACLPEAEVTGTASTVDPPARPANDQAVPAPAPVLAARSEPAQSEPAQSEPDDAVDHRWLFGAAVLASIVVVAFRRRARRRAR